MNYLSIGLPTDRIVYSVFYDKKLILYGANKLDSGNELEEKELIYNSIKMILKEHNIDIVAVKWVDYMHLKRKKALDLVSYRTLIKLACAELNVVYVELETYGWERYLEEITAKDKISIIKQGYNIKEVSNSKYVEKDFEPIADCIMLGEALAHKRLIAKPKQPINYKL
jgi:hypothetical protein